MKIKHIKIWVCDACLNGEGQMCHTPGCSLIRHKVDLPIWRQSYEVIGEMDEPMLEVKT